MIVEGLTPRRSRQQRRYRSAWHVDHASFGSYSGSALFGRLVGAICAGVVADRVGRK